MFVLSFGTVLAGYGAVEARFAQAAYAELCHPELLAWPEGCTDLIRTLAFDSSLIAMGLLFLVVGGILIAAGHVRDRVGTPHLSPLLFGGKH